jgi:DNA-binding NtrC family response regulator
MAKKQNLDDDWDDRVADDLPDEEEVLEEEIVPLDATSKRILLVDPDEDHAEVVMGLLQSVLAGAEIEHAIDTEEALEAISEETYDVVVIDLKVEGFSNSEFIKAVNNDPDTQLICFSLESLERIEEKNRYRLEPLKKLFEADKSAGTVKPAS